jgi:hypothetical protein
MAAMTTAGVAATGSTIGTAIGTGGTATAGTTTAATAASAGLGAADGTGPLLLHTTPTITGLTTTNTGISAISSSGLGMATKTAVGAKATALGVAGGGVLGLAAVGAAAAAIGYIEYGWLAGKPNPLGGLGEGVDRCVRRITEVTGSTVNTLVESFKEGYREGAAG